MRPPRLTCCELGLDVRYILKEKMLLREPSGEEESIIMSPQNSVEDLTPLREGDSKTELLNQGVLEPMLKSMRDYASYSELKKKILLVVAHNLDRNKLKKMARDFVAFDRDGEGTIDFAEFQKALESHNMENEELKRIFEAVDMDHTGRIRYNEFLAASVEALEFREDAALQDAFDRMDSDNSGYISCQNLRDILGSDRSDGEVRAMIEEVGGTSAKGIDYEHFLSFMREKRREETRAEIPLMKRMDSESDVSVNDPIAESGRLQD
eukprot:scaffold7352_cov254-Pinguiococcus_pyrenoidosus.AAC.30